MSRVKLTWHGFRFYDLQSIKQQVCAKSNNLHNVHAVYTQNVKVLAHVIETMLP